MSRARDWLRRLAPRDHSGPAVARLFHRLLGLVFLDAWLSLGVQVHMLIGARGLMPIAPFLARARFQLGFADFPTLFWLGVNDTTLIVGVVAGVVLSLVAIAGVAAARRRRVAGRALPQLRHRRAHLPRASSGTTCCSSAPSSPSSCRAIAARRWMHTLFRLILFKLYWESGIAKWQSHLHDWQDGSAMTYYYETAPLPTALAWYVHHAPVWWHHLESWATLGFELGVPFVIFAGPRRVRLACAAILTGFQIVNAATANYGFFCYLAAALHVFLLDDGDVARVGAWLRARLRLRPRAALADRAAAATGADPRAPGRLRRALDRRRARQLRRLAGALRRAPAHPPRRRAVAPRQHLPPVRPHHARAHRARIPDQRRRHHLGHARIPPQAGPARRRPDWVAPHQPRVDFQLWFYGLSYRAGAPEYVTTLLERLCRDPAAVQPLFRDAAVAAPARPCASSTGSTTSRPPPSGAPPAPGGVAIPSTSPRPSPATRTSPKAIPSTTSDRAHERFSARLRISSP